MFKRVTWFVTGAAAGVGGSLYAKRRVKAAVDKLAPEHIQEAAKARARAFGSHVSEAVREGRAAMHEREAELRGRPTRHPNAIATTARPTPRPFPVRRPRPPSSRSKAPPNRPNPTRRERTGR